MITPTREELHDIIDAHVFATDEWGGSKLADWKYGSNVCVGGIDEAVDAILLALQGSSEEMSHDALEDLAAIEQHPKWEREAKEQEETERIAYELSAPEPRQVMPKVNGKSFRCDCGCNVLTEISPLHYRCNGCGSEYTGEVECI